MQKRKPHPIIEQELFDDEELMWWGMPKPIHLIRLSDLVSTAVGLFFTAFAVFFISTASGSLGSSGFSSARSGFGGGFEFFQWIFYIIPIGFMGMGLWRASTPIRNYYAGMHTLYAVTNQRAIIKRTGMGSSVRSFYQRDIDLIKRNDRGDGTGDVIFAQEQVTRYRTGKYSTSGPYTVTIEHGFIGINEARYVEDVLVQSFLQGEKAKNRI